jgi:hypothetical protein
VGATVSVTKSTPEYHPGGAHHHTPCGRWDLIKDEPNSSFEVNRATAWSSNPFEVVNWAIDQEFSDKPIAKKHLYWYLWAGRGQDYVEDDVIDVALRQDDNLRRFLKGALEANGTPSGLITGHAMIDQSIYGHGVGQDIRFAWGSVDRFDYEADFNAGTFHAWFQDCYEWHPVYPSLYTQMDDDFVRPTNAVHAALVELKSQGAADFWMKGEATVPLSVILSAPPRPLFDLPSGLGLEDDL